MKTPVSRHGMHFTLNKHGTKHGVHLQGWVGEGKNNGKYHRRDSFKDEDPPPAVVSSVSAHCQAKLSQWTVIMAGSPSMGLSYILLPIAAANNPPNAPAKVVEPKNKVKRFCDSQRLYHIAVCRQVNHLASIQALGNLTQHIEASGEHAGLTKAQEEAGGE
jgi:hypothetical protein